MGRIRWLPALLGALVAAGALAGAGTGAAGHAVAKAADVSTASLAAAGIASAEPAGQLASLAAAPDLATPARPANAFVDRPGMPLDQYRAAKAAAAAGPRGDKQGAPATVAPLATTTLQGHAALSSECASSDGCWFPPDINGAVGTNQVVTVTNNHIDVYSKSPSSPSLLQEKTMASFFGYTAAATTDPRVEFDTNWNRWVVSIDAFQESGGAQHILLAVSLSSDATGGWYRYVLNLPHNGFMDYPQLGLTQDGVLLTYSDFGSSSQIVWTLGVAKTIVYNGRGFSVPVYSISSNGTLTPPDVIDQSSRAHELLEVPNGNVYNVMFVNPANGSYSSVSISTFSGIATTVPPQAPQPGSCGATSCMIDTSDGRFVNDPTQYGSELWAANTTGAGSFPVPHYYELYTEGPNKNTVKQSGTFYKSGTSYDWNASIVALAGGRAMMTWSYDDPSNNVNPSMAMTGRLASDSSGAHLGGVAVFNSAHNLQGNYDSNFGAQRWGDTSSIRYDPGTARTFGFNETVLSSGSLWGTHQGVLSLS